LPFTRLEAKPEALRDNLKSLIAYPFLVAKKGERPYIELENGNQAAFPLEVDRVTIVDPDSRRAFKRLIAKTFKKEAFHAAHVEWINRIQKLWKELDSNYNYRTYKSVQDKISENRKRLALLQ